MASYVFRGNLCGILCADCQEFLSGVKIRLYRLRPQQDITRLAVADPKTTLDVLDADQISAKQASLLGEFDSDAAGNFTPNWTPAMMAERSRSTSIAARSRTGRRARRPASRCSFRSPRCSRSGASAETLCSRRGALPAGAFLVPHPRAVRRLGHLRAGHRMQYRAPVEGVKVFAFDRDWLRTTRLVLDLPTPAGHFRIDYSGADFRRGTFINMELFGGPDVYFRVESVIGDFLLDEPPSAGRAAGRDNVGPCSASLCVDHPRRPARLVHPGGRLQHLQRHQPLPG